MLNLCVNWFGVLPNFFRLSPEIPEITEKLRGFAQAASRAPHAGLLIGRGRPAGSFWRCLIVRADFREGYARRGQLN